MEKLTRRKFIQRAAVLGGGVALSGSIANILAACGGGAAPAPAPAPVAPAPAPAAPAPAPAPAMKKLGGVVKMLGWTDKDDGSVYKKFKEKFGTDVVFTGFTDNAEAFGKLKAGGTSSFDTVFWDALWGPEFHRNDLVVPFDFKNMSSYPQYFPWFADLEMWQVGALSLSVPHGWAPTGICYNNTKVTMPAPEAVSLEMLLDPKYEGRVSIQENFHRNFIEFAPAITGFEDIEIDTPEGSRWDLPDDVLQRTKEELIRARKNFKLLFKTAGDAARALATEEVWFCHVSSFVAQEAADAGNPNIDFALPRAHKGTGWIDGQGMIKNDHNNEAVLEWINFFADVESQVSIISKSWLNSTNKECLDRLTAMGHGERLTKLGSYDHDADFINSISLFRPVNNPSRFQDAWAEFLAAG